MKICFFDNRGFACMWIRVSVVQFVPSTANKCTVCRVHPCIFNKKTVTNNGGENVTSLYMEREECSSHFPSADVMFELRTSE